MIAARVGAAISMLAWTGVVIAAGFLLTHDLRSALGRRQTSAVCSPRIIPRQKLIDATLPHAALIVPADLQGETQD